MRAIAYALLVLAAVCAIQTTCELGGRSTIGFFPPDEDDSQTNGSNADESNRTTFGGINSVTPAAGQQIPELGLPVSVVVISRCPTEADVVVRFFVSDLEVHKTELRVPPRTTLRAVGPDLTTRVTVSGKYVGDEGPTPSATWLAAVDFLENDTLEYIIPNPHDLCPDDPDKEVPGMCGCGVPDVDSDGDELIDCIEPRDTDGDGVFDPADNCASVANPGQEDCDGDGKGDACVIGKCGSSPSCHDCNENGIPDGCDLATNVSKDNDRDGVPDECQGDIVQACCFSDGGCSDMLGQKCSADYSGKPRGRGTSCATTTCPTPPEVCCLPDGTCKVLGSSACMKAEGIPQSPGTTCDDAACTPLEACCDLHGTCSNAHAGYCDGYPMGAGSTCSTTSCPAPPEETYACCLPDGSCQTLGYAECMKAEGISQSPGMTCDDAFCMPLEACCISIYNTCANVTVGSCYGYGMGAGSTCSTTSCPAPPEETYACCLPDGSCAVVNSFGACAELKGMIQSPGMTCTEGLCPVLTQACCLPESCEDVLPEECTALQGMPQGSGSTCAAGSCNLGACCSVTTGCSFVTAFECIGEWLGPDGSCSACLPYEPTMPCCLYTTGACAELTPSECASQGRQTYGLSCAQTGSCTMAGNCTENVAACDCLGGWIPDGTCPMP